MKPASVSATPDLRRALGTALPGARGRTPVDQEAIDDTVAGGCAIGLYLPAECRRHNMTSIARAAMEEQGRKRLDAGN